MKLFVNNIIQILYSVWWKIDERLVKDWLTWIPESCPITASMSVSDMTNGSARSPGLKKKFQVLFLKIFIFYFQHFRSFKLIAFLDNNFDMYNTPNIFHFHLNTIYNSICFANNITCIVCVFLSKIHNRTRQCRN